MSVGKDLERVDAASGLLEGPTGTVNDPVKVGLEKVEPKKYVRTRTYDSGRDGEVLRQQLKKNNKSG